MDNLNEYGYRPLDISNIDFEDNRVKKKPPERSIKMVKRLLNKRYRLTKEMKELTIAIEQLTEARRKKKKELSKLQSRKLAKLFPLVSKNMIDRISQEMKL